MYIVPLVTVTPVATLAPRSPEIDTAEAVSVVVRIPNVPAVPRFTGTTKKNPVSVAFSDELAALVTVTLNQGVATLLFSVNVPLFVIVPLGDPLPLMDTFR